MLANISQKLPRASGIYLNRHQLYILRNSAHDEYFRKFTGETKLSESEMWKIYEGFRKSDLDRNYILNGRELAKFTRHYIGRKLPEVEMREFLEEVDSNGKEKLTIEDIVKHLEKRFSIHSRERLISIFCSHDKDEDGYMQLHEFRAALFYIGFDGGHKEVKEIFYKYDTDNDRKITKEQFLKIVQEEMPKL